MPLDHVQATTEVRPFWIGRTCVEPGLNQMTTSGETTAVEHLAMRVLTILAAHPGQPVSREAILESVWAESAPNDEGLTQAICKLRKLLGDSPGESKIIQTVRKIGYRLVAPVSFEPPIAAAPLKVRHQGTDGEPVHGIRIRLSVRQLAATVGAVAALFVLFQVV